MNEKDFCAFLDNMLLDDLSRMQIKSLLSYFTNKRDGKPANKSYLFYGDPGVGKTYFAKTIIELMDREVVFCGKSAFRNKKTQACHNFDDVLGKIDNSKEQIIFLDGISFLLDRTGSYEIHTKVEREFMKVLDLVKRNQNKIMIATIEDKAYLGDDEVKRIEVKIEMDVPSFENKRSFLRTEYGNYLNGCQIDYIACNSFDYDYNDLSGLVKLACGHKRVTDAALRKIMGLYRPMQSCKSVIYRYTDTGLRDILGRKHVKTFLRKRMHLWLKYSNILFFCGLPGTGKTFAAKALAGEMNKPLVVVNISEYEDCSLQRILALVRRYENCIIFVEGAENIIDYYGFDERIGFRSQLDYLLDGAGKAPHNSILIFALSDQYYFVQKSGRTEILGFDLPDFAERKKFFRMKMNTLPEDIDVDYLARNTEGSYWDLERLCDDVIVCYLQDGKVDKKALEDVVRMWIKAHDRQRMDNHSCSE